MATRSSGVEATPPSSIYERNSAHEKKDEAGVVTQVVSKESDELGVAREEVDPTFESQTMRRVDFKLVPILSALYAFSLIDRTNLGLIRVAGADKTLHLNVGNRYSVITLIFFVPYIIFELPANIYIRRIGVRLFLSFICLAWGAATLAAGFVDNWKQLLAVRAVLGFLEAGFFPSCMYVISLWYTRREVQTRMSFFYMFSVLATGFSPILAYGLSRMDGLADIEGWSWIFIIEGALTMALAIIAYFIIVDFPDKNTFLTREQTQFVMARIERDRGDSEFDPLTMEKFLVYVKDLKLWGFAFCFLAATVPSYAISFFLPVILRGMNHSVKDAQLLSSPPYVCTVVYSISTSIYSDRIGRRAPFLIFSCLLCIGGLCMMGYADSNDARYGGSFLALMGATGNVPAVLAWQANNVVGQSKRAFSSALTISFGGIGGIFASLVFRQKDAPKYGPGIAAAIACQGTMIAVVCVTTAWFYMRNKQVREGTGRLIEGRAGFQYII